jgi:hypothetical protein
MRTLALCIAAAAFAAPAFAQQASDTLKQVIAHGQTMSGNIQTMDVTFTTTYAADGTYKTAIVDMDRTMTGKWTIEGDKLCTVGDGNPAKDCTVYPPGKKAGDTFTVEHPRLGTAKVTINP